MTALTSIVLQVFVLFISISTYTIASYIFRISIIDTLIFLALQFIVNIFFAVYYSYILSIIF